MRSEHSERSFGQYYKYLRTKISKNLNSQFFSSVEHVIPPTLSISSSFNSFDLQGQQKTLSRQISATSHTEFTPSPFQVNPTLTEEVILPKTKLDVYLSHSSPSSLPETTILSSISPSDISKMYSKSRDSYSFQTAQSGSMTDKSFLSERTPPPVYSRADTFQDDNSWLPSSVLNRGSATSFSYKDRFSPPPSHIPTVPKIIPPSKGGSAVKPSPRSSVYPPTKDLYSRSAMTLRRRGKEMRKAEQKFMKEKRAARIRQDQRISQETEILKQQYLRESRKPQHTPSRVQATSVAVDVLRKLKESDRRHSTKKKDEALHPNAHGIAREASSPASSHHVNDAKSVPSPKFPATESPTFNSSLSYLQQKGISRDLISQRVDSLLPITIGTISSSSSPSTQQPMPYVSSGSSSHPHPVHQLHSIQQIAPHPSLLPKIGHSGDSQGPILGTEDDYVDSRRRGHDTSLISPSHSRTSSFSSMDQTANSVAHTLVEGARGESQKREKLSRSAMSSARASEPHAGGGSGGIIPHTQTETKKEDGGRSRAVRDLDDPTISRRTTVRRDLHNDNTKRSSSSSTRSQHHHTSSGLSPSNTTPASAVSSKPHKQRRDSSHSPKISRVLSNLEVELKSHLSGMESHLCDRIEGFDCRLVVLESAVSKLRVLAEGLREKEERLEERKKKEQEWKEEGGGEGEPMEMKEDGKAEEIEAIIKRISEQKAHQKENKTEESENFESCLSDESTFEEIPSDKDAL
ncbi:hypothetical protein ADUPG1_013905 [Aduncisulcus paluster]|uniref:Uncharacterized protein n=1 Tax=Aduncisulcus paluster TaxID=2918883 RepID=A0ABQ5K8B4_9EUKA|nr:hypothetical protein ADUPG1_013905 [Aduncisulcus paluster]